MSAVSDAKIRGPYRESTKPVRVPLSLLGQVEALLRARCAAMQTAPNATATPGAVPNSAAPPCSPGSPDQQGRALVNR